MDPSQSADPTSHDGPPSVVAPGPLSAATVPGRTLPPPEWSAFEGPPSAASIVLGRLERGEPVPRRAGPRAELEWLSARMNAAVAAEDPARERATATELARALLQRGSEFDQATRLARRALSLGDDPVLREELASSFAMLGEPALAAATLRPLLSHPAGVDAGVLWTRIGTLLARAGEAIRAREAYEQAQHESPGDPNPPELAAAIGAWAPEVVAPAEAARFYLIAADCRERLGERVAAFENLLRAFEMAPESSVASERLSRWLFEHGRIAAADEVLREHARRLGTAGRGVHLGRLRDALRQMDLPRALGAALDARLDLEIDIKTLLTAVGPRESTDRDPSLLGFDELLEQVGLAELVAARLELGGESLSGGERAQVQMELGRLYAGPLGRPDRAAEAWIDALVSDPSKLEALRALASHAESTGDSTALVEALVRVGEPAGVTPERARCLRELVLLAEERLGDAALAYWGASRLSSVEGEGASLAETLARLEPRARLAEQALEVARADLEGLQGSDRVAPLLRMLALLHGRPDQVDAMLSVLLELIELSPAESTFQLGAERLLWRQARFEELEAFYERVLARAGSGAERARVLLALSHLRRRRGDLDGALTTLTPLASTAPAFSAHTSLPAPFCMLLLLAGQRGDEAIRARALVGLSVSLSAPVRAVLCAVAGELLLRVGHTDEAKAAVDQAVAAEPSLARPLAARATVGLVSEDSWAVEAMERAMGVVIPRAAFCEALASAYDELGEPLLALAFGQRQIALRPGDLSAASARLIRTLKLGDAERLAETLSWLLAQPQPLKELGEKIAAGLRALATLDPARGTTLARKALDALGPRSLEIRLAVLSVADIAGERGLGLAALERWLASGAESSERAELLLDLARRRRASGDHDGSARSLLRAMRAGAWATAVLAEFDIAPSPKGSDGEIALLAARAEALSALSEADHCGTALAWRELGAAYWDLADNTDAAIRAWERACVLDGERGIENFASDLSAFGGVDLAIQRLADFALRRSDPTEGARVLALSAAIALDSGKPAPALRAALGALTLDSRRAEVVALIERAATEADLDSLEHAYGLIGAAVLGRHGERAIHLRAARHLERRQATAGALSHAVAAFEAMPSEGISFVLLTRLSQELGDSEQFMNALWRVANLTPDLARRAVWLRRAVALPATSAEGLRQKVELLLQFLRLRPEADLLGELGETFSALLRISPDDREVLQLRLERALSSVLETLEGPTGARLSIRAARVLLEILDAPLPALQAVLRAITCDARVEEYAELEQFVAMLAPYGEALCKRVVELASDRPTNGGPALLAFGASLCLARGQARSAAELLVNAACENSDDPGLVRRAHLAARQSGDPALIERLLDAIPERDRVQALLELADAAEHGGDLLQAVEILEGARSLERLSEADSARILSSLMDRYRRLGQRERVEELLEEQIQDAHDVQQRSRLAAELAALVGARGDRERALTILELALRDAPRDLELLSDYVALVRQQGDSARLIRGLTTLLELVADPAESAAWLRELAELLELSGDLTGASARWAELLRLSPQDPVALLALDREAERRGDYEALITLLSARVLLAGSPDEVRRIRLRRAAVLEHRLGRAEEARSELEDFTATTGDHRSVLRVLSDLNERLGAPLRAAPLWLRASAVTTDREEASDLAIRACEAYLSGGDLASARRVLDGTLTWARSERALGLAVEIERRAGNSLALAEAIDELVRVSAAEPERKASLLMEAAQASVAGGALDEARAHAERARELAPASARAHLLLRWLDAKRSEAPVGADDAMDLEELNALADSGPSDAEPLELSPGQAPAPADLEANRRSGFAGRYSLRLGEAASFPPLPSDLPGAGDSSSKVLKLSRSEAELYSALAAGSIEAGETLIRELEQRPDRTRDLVSVCRRLSTVLPGDLWPLGLLHDAAVADKNVSYAHAIQHVVYTLQPGRPRIEPPPLDEQVEQPDAVRALLLRDGSSPALEALALVWEGAEHVFRRDASAYGVTGLERVPLSAPTPLARAYSAAARSLGMLRTPLFQRRSSGAVTLSLALLNPPAIVLSGDVRHDSPEIGYQLGAMLVGTLPQYVLLMGSPESQARAVLRGLGFAFGPPDRASAPGSIPSLAEVLWESIPARLQRRLRELCSEPEILDYEAAMRAARLAVRRAGLFVSGDLRVALRETCVEEGIALDALESPAEIAELCRTSASARSLLLLATSAEYAETRWQASRTSR